MNSPHFLVVDFSLQSGLRWSPRYKTGQKSFTGGWVQAIRPLAAPKAQLTDSLSSGRWRALPCGQIASSSRYPCQILFPRQCPLEWAPIPGIGSVNPASGTLQGACSKPQLQVLGRPVCRQQCRGWVERDLGLDTHPISVCQFPLPACHPCWEGGCGMS